MKKSLEDVKLSGKKVFLRVDMNVPISGNAVQDVYRIQSILPSLQSILDQSPKQLIIGSHLGRPKGKPVQGLSLKPVYEYLKGIFEAKYERKLVFCNIESVANDQYVLLENLRFYPDEEDMNKRDVYEAFFKNNVDFVVVDAFGVLHRNCGSIVNTGKPTVAGLLVLKELAMHKIVQSSTIDLMILGGSKVEDKVKLIGHLICKTRRLFLTGGLAFSYMKYAKQREIGKSICNKDSEALVWALDSRAEHLGVKILCPVDFIVRGKNGYFTELEKNDTAVDIGQGSLCLLQKEISKAGFIFWNGPPGMFETKEYEAGTKRLVEMLSCVKGRGGCCVVGGGDTASAVLAYSEINNFTHVSTGGGAFMQLISGEEMPGLKAIENKTAL